MESSPILHHARSRLLGGGRERWLREALAFRCRRLVGTEETQLLLSGFRTQEPELDREPVLELRSPPQEQVFLELQLERLPSSQDCLDAVLGMQRVNPLPTDLSRLHSCAGDGNGADADADEKEKDPEGRQHRHHWCHAVDWETRYRLFFFLFSLLLLLLTLRGNQRRSEE